MSFTQYEYSYEEEEEEYCNESIGESKKFEEFTEKDNFEYKSLIQKKPFIEVENFEKQEKIGEGSFGKVYKVVNKQDGKIYSAKISFHEIDMFSNPEMTNFFREVNLMSLLNFPSITKFYGYSPICLKKKPKPMIICEYESNDTLYHLLQLINKGDNIPEWTDTLKLINIYGIARALEYLHSNHILHRDLKPDNILLNDYLFPKIADFGLSKMIDYFNIILISETRPTSSSVIANPEYVAPEVIENDQYSNSSDVYSFAMIVYEIMTNERPFNDLATAYDIVNEVIKNNARPKFNKNIPACYHELIEKCWSSEPKKRPSFKEIVNDLENNEEYIIENVNIDEYLQYIKYINSSLKGNNDFSLDKFFKKVSIYKNRIKEEEVKNISINVKLVYLNNYEIKEQIGKGSYGTVYKIKDKESSDIYAAKISISKLNKSSEDKIINLEREVNIISKINYPSILKFIGFSTNNFKHKLKPTIITEYAQNGSLDKIIELERNSLSNQDWNDTLKLINIYGIASGMAYLHSQNILHRDLKPGNILLDNYLFPKISDFGLSKQIYDVSNEKRQIKSGYKGTPAYSAPEVFQEIYTKAGDVFSFSLIVYEIMTTEIPYSKMNQYQLLSNVCSGFRPSFKYPLPYSYQKLIEDCWADNPSQRPSFDEIVTRLKNDKGFITQNVDENEFLNYTSYIDESINKTPTTIKQSFREISVDLKKQADINDIKETILMKELFLDLKKYEKGELIMKGDLYKSYKVKSKETGAIYFCKISMVTINNFSLGELIKLSREVNLISQLKHPSFLKFIGYSPSNFKNQQYPVLVTEHPSNGTLFSFLEKERRKRKVLNWNDTKKLIIIFGIAAGMSYLHSNNIVHRDLNPKNVFLDEKLYPKLGDFGLSVRSHKIDTMTYQSTSGMKGTPIYSSPEILQYNDYSKSSDVYAFSLIVYEIITKNIPFNGLENINDIYTEVVIKNNRPEIDSKIPKCYRQMIEICWAQNKDERPTFEDIIHILLTDTNFITDKIDKDEYYKYIQLIEQNKQNTGKINKKIHHFDNLIKKKPNSRRN